MKESPIDIPCPICHISGQVSMIAHIDEIPYFGEHTQVTVMCQKCGWKQTDFIPAEGKKAGCWSLKLTSESKLTVRVVRSSSCTIRIPELDLHVNPGSSSTGFVSNVEGVLNRFLEVINIVRRDLNNDLESVLSEHETNKLNEINSQIKKLDELILRIKNAGSNDTEIFTLELLDPHGHSMILDDDAEERDLSVDEIMKLPVGPDPAVFSA
tara:strand:- start:375 stop:1007 length:633 start_codon:yes stop_codon:yes gene_type:complete